MLGLQENCSGSVLRCGELILPSGAENLGARGHFLSSGAPEGENCPLALSIQAPSRKLPPGAQDGQNYPLALRKWAPEGKFWILGRHRAKIALWRPSQGLSQTWLFLLFPPSGARKEPSFPLALRNWAPEGRFLIWERQRETFPHLAKFSKILQLFTKFTIFTCPCVGQNKITLQT